MLIEPYRYRRLRNRWTYQLVARTYLRRISKGVMEEKRSKMDLPMTGPAIHAHAIPPIVSADEAPSGHRHDMTAGAAHK